MSVYDLKEAIDKLPLNPYLRVHEGIWFCSHGDLMINEEDNEDDLLEGEGETYSWEVYEPEEQGNWLFFDGDSGQGWREHIIVRKDKEVKDE